MDLNCPSLAVIKDVTHSLLDPPSPAYSNVTVRRAFVVWMYCGQTNKFKDVCNYYHYLEALEDKLPPEQRAISRHLEFNMFLNPPTTSRYLQTHFPKLYSDSPIEPYYIKKLEAIKNEKCIFKLEGFHQIRQKGVTTAEIIETSQIIRKYCITQLIPLRKFLEEYRQYAKKCDLTETVYNVAAYIKRKMVHAELEIIANFPQDFSFLHSSTESIDHNDSLNDEVDNDAETAILDDANQTQSVLEDHPYLNTTNEDIKEENSHNSCTNFFEPLNQADVRVDSYAPLTPKIEDLVSLIDQNRRKSRSVESLIQGTNILDTFNFTSMDNFDTSDMKISELNKLRKI